MRLTSKWARRCHSPEVSALQFYNQRKRGKKKKNLSFLSRQHASIVRSSSRLGREFSCPFMVKLVSQMIGVCVCVCFFFFFFFNLCREHVLGIINLPSSLDRMWFSSHHCFIVWGHILCFCCMVLLLS